MSRLEMGNSNYLEALEMRLAWLRWAQSEEGGNVRRLGEKWAGADSFSFDEAWDLMLWLLEWARATYYVTPMFGELIAHTGAALPTSITFEKRWLQSDTGVLFFDRTTHISFGNNYTCSTPKAIGWVSEPQSDTVRVVSCSLLKEYLSKEGAVTYQAEFEERPAFMISQTLALKQNADLQSGLINKPENWPERQLLTSCNETIYIWATLALMAEKLAVISGQEGNRAQRRRLEHEQVPIDPVVKVVSLRRLEKT